MWIENSEDANKPLLLLLPPYVAEQNGFHSAARYVLATFHNFVAAVLPPYDSIGVAADVRENFVSHSHAQVCQSAWLVWSEPDSAVERLLLLICQESESDLDSVLRSIEDLGGSLVLEVSA